VLKWPNAQSVDQAARRWAERVSRERKHICRIGYFGSYARGDWGVGSDLDLIIIVNESDQPFERRARNWDTTELPVPTDVLVYTWQEWESLQLERFCQTIADEAVWIYDRNQNWR
jgi:predicted nucleotidyltransferase